MFQLYSRGCEYTLQALIVMGADSDRAYTAREICQAAGIPESYTRKTFQALVRGGFLNSLKGPGGGYRLVNRPEEISVLSVIEAVEGKENFAGCVMGLGSCNNINPCPLHFTWIEVKEKLLLTLEGKSLSDLIETRGSKK